MSLESCQGTRGLRVKEEVLGRQELVARTVADLWLQVAAGVGLMIAIAVLTQD